MEINTLELAAIETRVPEINVELKELSELQLTLIGGGIGDPIAA